MLEKKEELNGRSLITVKLKDSVSHISNLFLFRGSARETPQRESAAKEYTALLGGTKYFKQEPIQRRFDFSGVLYFGWPDQPSSGTMRVYIELLLCTYIYIYIVNGC